MSRLESKFSSTTTTEHNFESNSFLIVRNVYSNVLINCVRRRKNTFLLAFGVEIVWDNQQMNEWIVLGRAITNLAKEREPGIEFIECTPKSLIITSLVTRSITKICCHFKTQKCLTVSRNNEIIVKFVKNYHPSAIKLSISASGQRQGRPVWIET